MSATLQQQHALDEIQIENKQLEDTLEDRQRLKEHVKGARKAFKEADDRARALLSTHGLQDDQVARVGRYRITKKTVASRTVQFETDPTSRVTISLIPE